MGGGKREGDTQLHPLETGQQHSGIRLHGMVVVVQPLLHGACLFGLLRFWVSHRIVFARFCNTVSARLRAVDNIAGSYSIYLCWLNYLRIMEYFFLRVEVSLGDIPSGQALLLALLGSGIAYLIYLGREESK